MGAQPEDILSDDFDFGAPRGIGDNRPPSAIEFTIETRAAMNEFLAAEPVIESEETARAAKLIIDRVKDALAAMEAERDGKVRPLNKQVADINALYRPARETTQTLLDELLRRLTAFARAEERRRWQEAEAKRKAAEDAERIAREAEAAELAAKENASVGEIGVDIAAVVEQADQAFDEFKRAERAAALAERETPVRLGGGFRPVMTMRTKTTLIITNVIDAVTVLWPSEDIREAVLKSARTYKKQYGRLPPGVSEKIDRGF